MASKKKSFQISYGGAHMIDHLLDDHLSGRSQMKWNEIAQLANNQHLQAHHIDKILSSPLDDLAHLNAVRHPAATGEHLKKALNHDFHRVRAAVFDNVFASVPHPRQHPGITPDMVMQGM